MLSITPKSICHSSLSGHQLLDLGLVTAEPCLIWVRAHRGSPSLELD